MNCSISECEGRVQAKGLCFKHYQRLRRHGDAHGKAIRKKEAIENRLKKKIRLKWNKKLQSHCWCWTGAKSPEGYGMIRNEHSQMEQAHRVAYRIWNGLIIGRNDIHHKCENLICFNPAHLEQLTRSQHKLEHSRM